MSDVLDREMLEELQMIMEDEFPSLMETFLQESARQYADAKEAWSAGNLEMLRRSAHTLKGSCGNVGADGLQGSCATLETFARQGTVQDIPDLLDRVGRQLEEVNAAIRAL